MIRELVAGDEDDVVRLVVAAGLFSDDETAVVRELLRGYGDASATAGDVCLVDEHAGRLAGVAYCRRRGPADRLWDLTMMAVAPGLQATGRGTALLRRLEDDLGRRGQRMVLVETSGTAQYEPAREFYLRRGYTQVARVHDYWTDGDDLVLFARRLA